MPPFFGEQALANMQVNKESDTVVYIHPRLAVDISSSARREALTVAYSHPTFRKSFGTLVGGLA